MQEQAMYHKPETQYAYALSENSKTAWRCG